MTEPWEVESILRDQNNDPIPQIWCQGENKFKPYTREIWGATTATRPDADAVEVGTVFVAIDGGAFNATISDGTNWVVV